VLVGYHPRQNEKNNLSGVGGRGKKGTPLKKKKKKDGNGSEIFRAYKRSSAGERFTGGGGKGSCKRGNSNHFTDR